MAGGGNYDPRCGACKYYQKSCKREGCDFAPFFPPNDDDKFMSFWSISLIHKYEYIYLNLLKSSVRKDKQFFIDGLVDEARRRNENCKYGAYADIYTLTMEGEALKCQISVISNRSVEPWTLEERLKDELNETRKALENTEALIRQLKG